MISQELQTSQRQTSALSSGALSEEDRKFLQHRVGRFGMMAGAVFLAFYLFRVVEIFADANERLLDPSMNWHLGSAFCLWGTWGATLGGTRSARAIRAIETAGLLSTCFCIAIMGAYIPPLARPDYILVLSLGSALIIRALYVPSTARRTLTLSAIPGGPVLAVIYVVMSQMDAEQYAPVFELMGVTSTSEAAVGSTVFAAAWWIANSAVAASASRVIYGLRREVRDAKQLGQYRLVRKLGEGGMGTVYRASHAMLRRPTAIKLLRREHANPEQLARFEREVQLTAQLSHPNTVNIYDYGRTPEGVFYYAMELIDGGTLATIVDVTGAQPVDRALYVLEQMVAALVEAHGVGLIHRDIKPANVMLSMPHVFGGAHEAVRVLDFGLVKQLESTDAQLTQANTIAGTPHYMSPESIAQPETVDARSDLYAVGAVGYFLLTGEHVFAGTSAMDVCGKHLHVEPQRPSERVQRELPADVEQLIMECLAKKREERPASAFELQNRLTACESWGGWTPNLALEWWEEYGDALERADSSETPDLGTIEVARV